MMKKLLMVAISLIMYHAEIKLCVHCEDHQDCIPQLFQHVLNANRMINISTSQLCTLWRQFNPIFIKRYFQHFLGNNTDEIICVRTIPLHTTRLCQDYDKNINQIHNLNIRNVGSGAWYTGECHNIVTKISVTYLGKLPQNYYPTSKFKLKNVHVGLVRNGSTNSLSIAAVGKLYLCETHEKCRLNTAVYVNENKDTIIEVDSDFLFKTSWIDSNFIQTKPFQSAHVQYISRFNLNYYTNLHLHSKTTKMKHVISRNMSKPTILLIKDNKANFTSLYTNDKTELEHYEDVDTEFLVCCRDFLGVYMKLKMINLLHFAKIAIPVSLPWKLVTQFLPPWSDILANTAMQIFFLSGNFQSDASSYHSILESIIYQAMNKHKFYEGLLVEMNAIITNHKEKPSFLLPNTYVHATLKYSQQATILLTFNSTQEDARSICCQIKGKAMTDFNNFLWRLKMSSGNVSTAIHEQSTGSRKTCRKGYFRLNTIRIELPVDNAGAKSRESLSIRITVLMENRKVIIYDFENSNMLSYFIQQSFNWKKKSF